jgi:hypothetical protein
VEFTINFFNLFLCLHCRAEQPFQHRQQRLRLGKRERLLYI